MATCYYVCTSDNCGAYRAPNEVWNYNGSGIAISAGCSADVTFPTGAGSIIYDENIERLWGAINDERNRRGLSDYNFQTIAGSSSPDNATPTTPQSSDNSIIHGNNSGNYDQFIKMKTAINQIRNVLTFSVVDGQPVPYTTMYWLKYWTDRLRSECICNTDCGAHTVCTCHTVCSCHTYVYVPPPAPTISASYLGYQRLSANTVGHTHTHTVSLPSGTKSVFVTGHTKQNSYAKRRITAVIIGGGSATKFIDAIRDSSEYNAHSSIWGYSWSSNQSGNMNIQVDWDNGGDYDAVGWEIYALNKEFIGSPETNAFYPDSYDTLSMPITLNKYNTGFTLLCWCNYFTGNASIQYGMSQINMQYIPQLNVSCWEIPIIDVLPITYQVAQGYGSNDGQTACGISFPPAQLLD